MVTELVHRRSEGVPYFVAELATSAARGCIDMPDTLRDALSVRISLLSDDAVDTLRLAAVAGNRVDHPLLEAVSDAAPTTSWKPICGKPIDASVLIADETGYAFRHALLREVVEEDMLPGQHARYARPLRRAARGAPRAGRHRRRVGDRPPLVGGARRRQGVPVVDPRGRVRRRPPTWRR